MILDKSVVVRGNGGIQQHVLNLQGRITCVTKVLGPRSRCWLTSTSSWCLTLN
jgi:hypothetical protein